MKIINSLNVLMTPSYYTVKFFGSCFYNYIMCLENLLKSKEY